MKILLYTLFVLLVSVTITASASDDKALSVEIENSLRERKAAEDRVSELTKKYMELKEERNNLLNKSFRCVESKLPDGKNLKSCHRTASGDPAADRNKLDLLNKNIDILVREWSTAKELLAEKAEEAKDILEKADQLIAEGSATAVPPEPVKKNKWWKKSKKPDTRGTASE